MLVRDERTPEHPLHGVIHAHARFKGTKRPEPHPLAVRARAQRERQRAHGTHEAAQLGVERQRRLVRAELGRGRVRRDGRVQQRAEHHRDHKGRKDVPERQGHRRGGFRELLQ